jgi:ABC-type Fe3+ transport system permease subunit
MHSAVASIGLFVLTPAAMVTSLELVGRAVNRRAAIIEGPRAMPIAAEYRSRQLIRLYMAVAVVFVVIVPILLALLITVTLSTMVNESPEAQNPNQGIVPVAEALAGLGWAWYLWVARQRWRSKERITPPFNWLK